MADLENSVFISYRRSTSRHLARAIFMDLRAHGYDVFMDVDTLDNGAFDEKLLREITNRTHFVLLLSQGAMDRCNEPGDWLRREIEQALEANRNIVPIIEEGFQFEDASSYLTGKLSVLPRYNAVPLYHAYFDAALENLRTRFLRPSGERISIAPAPVSLIPETPKEKNLTPQQKQIKALFNRAVQYQQQGNYKGAVADYTEVIRLDADYALAYRNRGMIKSEQGDYSAGILDLNQAIRLNPNDAEAYRQRAWIRFRRGKVDGCVEDYNEALRLDPFNTEVVYSIRGWAYYEKGEYAKSIADFTEAIRRDAKDIHAYSGRAASNYHSGNYEATIADDLYLLGENPKSAVIHNNLAEAYFASGQYERALEHFKQALRLKADLPIAMAGLAVTQYQLDQKEEAVRLWRKLLQRDNHYQQAEWVQSEHKWVASLTETARQLIASLPDK
jgi:tetratricopeptide (TPR) repeat protein